MAGSNRSNLKILGNYLRPYWKKTSIGIGTLLLVNVLGVYIPLLIRNGIDELQASFSFDRVFAFAVTVMVLASVMWVIRMVSRVLVFGVGRQVEFDLKQRIFQHLLTLEPAYFAVNTAGDLINRTTSDVDNIRRLMGFAVLSLANTLFAYALTLPIMLSINVRLTLLALLVYPLMLVLVQLFANQLRTQQLEVQERLSEMSDLIQEDMSGISPIKIYAQEENERQAFRRVNDQLLRVNLSFAKTRSVLFPLLGGLASVSLLVLLWFGSDAIAQGELSIGNFVALLIYVERLVFPTALLGFTISTYQRGEVSINRVEAILQTEPKIIDNSESIALPLDQVVGHLKATHLSYGYPGSDRLALNDLNFEIKPGEMVAIVGPVGCGKSTLANALPRLLDLKPGQLWLDGIDITQLRIQDLRGAIAYVPQDSFLFSTSIANNIRYGNPAIDLGAVEAAADTSQIRNEILTFPQQYETVVGERGITLSGGQRQRTALARALLISSPILILDDALSSVDNKTATEILRNLTDGTAKKTVIFISHQMSAAATADRILVMDQGSIVDMGTHDELLSRPGLYRDLWNQHTLETMLVA
ncbi:MAG: ABC transporter ATP-binding protein [Limnothrix sp.]|uniref:ABC transporter ATP-binding protein n=1 Tax=unclassified Limnothrix TaxID=2632864 RepID=UPI0016811168|nr:MULTISPECIES: ABC transporter ATP-binding protein [unclassified Limnothrix]MBD2159242.1 ABC transporter ATP-binding protein [Limnothrix sp. FACHB-1083]MBD2191947.1 ABC transporter ATP-binding protein [Limnothrix sp. FACHB-1088]MEB3118343.1 ABC transporter ATP-binding protein [Limnothrix sp.]